MVSLSWLRRTSLPLMVVGCLALSLVSSQAPSCSKCTECPSEHRSDSPPSTAEGRLIAPSTSSDSVYVRQQTSKLKTHFDEIKKWDENEIEPQLTKRFKVSMGERTKGSTVLCVGARLGGEVRAFKNLGALAVGIDMNPGLENNFVLHGSATSLQFASGLFDIVYTNILDHIDDLALFFEESKRVLRQDGMLMIDVDQNPKDEWAVRDLRGEIPKFIKTLEIAGFSLLSDEIVLDEKDKGKHALIFALNPILS